MNADIKVNEKVKMYLNELNYGYQFPYLFEGEKYGLVNNLNKLDRPILILGPENDNKYKTNVRKCTLGNMTSQSCGVDFIFSGMLTIYPERRSLLSKTG